MLKLKIIGNNFFMKILRLRLAIFLLISFCLICVPNQNPVFNYHGADDITYFYYVCAKDLKLENVTVTTCGEQSIVECKPYQAKNIKNKLGQILGESIRIKNCDNNTIDDILNNYIDIVLYEENIDDYRLIYCYDKTLSNNIFLKDKKVNIQIAIKNNEVNIGYPLILNGF